MTTEAVTYLTDEELQELAAVAGPDDDEMDMAALGWQVVLREFVIHLCGQYGVSAKDLEDREESI